MVAISKADKALFQKLASKYGFSLTTASEASVMPEPTVSVIEQLVAKGQLVALSGYRTSDKEGFSKLREFATANKLKINTQSVIVSITPE